MRWWLGVGLRLMLHISATIFGIIIFFFGLAGTLIALGGTGALTTSPPPEHPRYAAALVVVSISAALAAALFYFWRALLRMIDRAEAR